MNEIIQNGNIFPTKTRDNPNQGRVYDARGVAPSLNCAEGGNRQPYIIALRGRDTKNGRTQQTEPIRRLTPRECWRLFDFEDADFEKAQKVNSDTQLYKQAGNSIIINVLTAALRNLHINEHIEVLELFGGIGAPRKALQNLSIDFHTADYVEIDKFAAASYNAIFDEHFAPQDVTRWDKDLHIDFIFHGSPCQDFSVAGLGRGGEEGSGTRSSLMFETIRIVQKSSPKYVLWENVKGAISPKHRHNFDKYLNTMSELGYNTYRQIMDGKDYGTPQSRERIIAISIRKDVDYGYEFPSPIPLAKYLSDILEDDVPEKYYVRQELSEKFIEQIKQKQISNTIRAGGRGSIDRHTWDLVVG